MLHDALRQTETDARHPRQQRRGRRIGIDADRVDAVLDHGIERARQLGFAKIVLILPDTDRLGIDLDQFGQRILQPPGDRHRAAKGHVELGQFLRRKRRRRIDRRAGFRNHDLRHFQVVQQLDQFGGELVGLARRRAVADRDQIDAVGDRELAQRRQRFVPLPLRFMRIDHRGRHHLAGRIDHRNLDAGAIAGIEPHGHARTGGRRQQQVAQVRSEHTHALGLGGGPQPHPQIDVEMHLDLGAPRPPRGVDQPAIAQAALIGNGKALHDLQLIRARRAGAGRGRLRIRHDLQFEDFLLLAAEHRENAVRRQLAQRLRELEIVLELLALGLLALAHRRGHQSVRPHLLAQAADQIGVFGKALHQDGARAFERRSHVGDLFLGIDETSGHGLRIVLRLRQQHLGQRLQPRLPRDLGLGAALGLKWQVDVFQPSLAVGGHDRCFQRAVELALFADRIEDRCAALFQFAQIGQPLFQRAQLHVIQTAGDFLAVARHERDRGATIQQFHRCVDLLLAYAEFFRDLSIDICHANSFLNASPRVNRPPPDAAYGPSPIISSRRHTKQIDLWMDLKQRIGRQ